MNEDAIKDSYGLFVTEGYNGTIEDYKELLNTNSDALNDAFELFKGQGYTDTINDFSVIMGVGKPTGVVEMDATVTPEPEPVSESMDLESEDISLEQYDAMTPAEKKKIKNYKLKQRLIRESAAKRKAEEKNEVYIPEEKERVLEEDYFSNIGKKITANTYRALGGIAELPNFLNSIQGAIGRVSMTEEQKEKYDALDVETQDLINSLNAISFVPGAPQVSISSLAQAGRKKYNEYKEKANELNSTIKQYETSIGEEIAKGNLAKATARTFSEAVGSLPSLVQAMIPGVGIASIAAGSAAQAAREAREEGEDLSLKTLGYGTVVGASEGLLEVVTKRIGTQMFKQLAGKSKSIVNKTLKDFALDVSKKYGAEGLSETATEVLNKTAELAILGREDAFDNAFSEFVDVFLIGGMVGGGIGSTGGGAEIIRNVAQGKTIKKELAKTDYNNLIDAYSNEKTTVGIPQLTENPNTKKFLEYELNQQVKKGDITKEESDKIKLNFRETQGVVNSIKPLGLDEAFSPEIVNLVKRQKELQEKIKEVDNPALTESESESLKNVNEELKSLVVKAKESKITKGAKAVAEAVGFEVNEFDTSAELEAEIENINKEIKDGSDIDVKEAAGQLGFILQYPDGKQRVLLNKEQALKENVVSTAAHEVLHGVLFNTVKNQGVGEALGKSLIDELNKIDADQIKNSDFKNRLNQYKESGISQDQTFEEALTLFSESLINGDLVYEENLFTKIGDFIRRTLAPVVKIKFNKGRDVYNFIRDYNRTIETGKGLKAVEKAAKGIAGKLTESQELSQVEDIVLKDSKSTKGTQASEEVQRIYEDQGTAGAFDIIQQFKPTVSKLAERRRDAPGFDRELLIDEIETGQRGILDLINSYDPSKGVPLAAYINKLLPARAIEASKRVLGEVFESDVTEQVSVAAPESDITIEEKVQESIKPTEEQKSKLRRQIKLPDEQVEKVREAVRKTFGTRLPPLQSPEFKKALRKAFDTELFKELKTNVFKARKDYEFFMSQNWKALYDAIPQETLNQSFAPFREAVLDETGKQKREKTPEGERIFRKKNITKEEFLDYFFNPNVGVSTRGTRKDAIVRMLAQELGFDATMETIQEPKVAEKIEFLDKEKTVPKVAEKIGKDPTVKFSKAREIQNTQVRLKKNPGKNITLIDVFAKDLKSFDKNPEKQESFDSFYKNSIAGFKKKYIEQESEDSFNAKPWKPIIYEYWVAKNILLKYPNLEIEGGLAKGFDSTGQADLVFVDKNNPKNKFNVEVKSTQDAMVSSAKVKLKDGKFVATVPEKQNNVIFSIINKITKDKISNIKKALGTNDDEIINRAFTNPTDEQLEKIRKQLPGTRGEPSNQFVTRTEADFKDIAKSIKSKGTNVFVLQNKKGDTIMYALDEKTQKQILESLGIEVPVLDGKIKIKVRLKSNTGDRKTYTPTLEPEFDRNVFREGAVFLDPKVKSIKIIKPTYEKLNKEFNEIIENKTSIAASKTYDEAKARLVGDRKTKFRFFIPPSADDFMGLLYYTLGKGKVGDAQLKWYNENLISPFAQAMEAVSRDRNETAKRFKTIIKDLGIVPKKLRKVIPGEDFTQEQAVRVYVWDKQDMSIPGLSDGDKAALLDYIDNNKKLEQFADKLLTVNKSFEYAKPGEAWVTGNIVSDLKETLNTTKRATYLEQWQKNVDEIFSKQNLNKLEAAFGRDYRLALENSLQRMKTGRNRSYGPDSLTGRFNDWINGSVGAIMFFNTRSAILQTISAINFINFSDNNVFAAAKAFANQKQYWSDFKKLFNSDFLKDRREGLRMDINEADLAAVAKQNGAKGVINRILKLGFTPTQIADSFAIASGGATFYRNRLNSLMKEGMDEKAAEKIAFQEFRETAEESQQSSRPDKISQQQAGPLGRIILAFANTPSQYARLMKKAALDLKNNRGDAKTNISKIIYYAVVQNLIFNAAQQALFALMFAEEEDEELKDKKIGRVANGMADSVLRGLGFTGAIASTVKNITLKLIEQSKKQRPEYQDAMLEVLKVSPPISSKMSKLRSAARTYDWNKKEMLEKGISLDNPAALALGQLTSAITNIPLDRGIKKVQNVEAAINDDLATYQRLALIGGWSKWDLGIQDKKVKPKTYGPKKREVIKREVVKRN